MAFQPNGFQPNAFQQGGIVTAPAPVPFATPDAPTARRAPFYQAAGYYGSNALVAALSLTVSRPQYGALPVKRPYVSQPPSFSRNPLLLDAVAVQDPFRLTGYDTPARRPPANVGDFIGNPTLLAPVADQPFAPTVAANAVTRTPFAHPPGRDALNLNLLGQDTFFGAPGQSLIWTQPNPVRRAVVPQADFGAMPLAVLAQATTPFVQTPYANPVIRARAQQSDYTPAPTVLTSVVTPAPFLPAYGANPVLRARQPLGEAASRFPGLDIVQVIPPGQQFGFQPVRRPPPQQPQGFATTDLPAKFALPLVYARFDPPQFSKRAQQPAHTPNRQPLIDAGVIQAPLTAFGWPNPVRLATRTAAMPQGFRSTPAVLIGFWTPVDPTSEFWTPVDDTTEIWAAVATVTETWTAAPDTSEVWTPVDDVPEGWTPQ